MGRISSAFSTSHNPFRPVVTHLGLIVIAVNCLVVNHAWAEVAEKRQLLDRIVAIVNDKPILNSIIEDKLSRGPLVLVSPYPATTSSKPFEQALQDAINLELVLKRADELEIEIDDSRIEQQITSLTEHNKISRSQLQTYLLQQGKSFDDYREDLRKQMTFMRFKGRELLPKVKITSRDIEAKYIKTYGSDAASLEIYLRHILVSIPAGANADVLDAKKAMVDQVYKKLTDGMNFKDAVRIFSDQKSASNDVPALKMMLSDLPKELQEPVSKLAIGSFTAPIKTSAGFQVVYLEEKKFASNGEFTSKQKELEQKLREERLAQVTRSWLESARQRAKIKVIAN